MKKFADKLIQLRTQKSLSRNQLAKELNVSPNTIKRWESGKDLRFKNLISLANYFDVSVDELVGRDFPPIKKK